MNVGFLTPLTAILWMAQHPLTTAVLFKIHNIEHREMAGNRVNPGGEGGKFLEGGGGECLQREPAQGVVSPRRMA